MPDYKWPEFENRSLIGGRISRLDGAVKTTGAAKYTYDVNRPGMLYGVILTCPHARAKITRMDASRAESMPGVRLVHLVHEVGTEIKWAMDEIAYVVAETENGARDAARAIAHAGPLHSRPTADKEAVHHPSGPESHPPFPVWRAAWRQQNGPAQSSCHQPRWWSEDRSSP